MKTQPDNREQPKAKPQPTHDVKVRLLSFQEKAKFERIGAAWQREDGSVYVKLCGTQIIDNPFYLFPVETER